jgi:hypothetical protein
MPKLEKCDRCLFYAHDPHLVCAEHPNGVDSDCLDFRVNPKFQEEELWSPDGYYWYNGELLENRRSQLTTEQKLEILDAHPFFTGQCPNCGHEFDRANLPMIHWDCPSCGWVDDSV